MTDDTTLPFAFPAVGRKKVTAAFDGGRITSDGGVMLLAQAERRLDIAGKLAAAIPDHRDPARCVHALADILRARIFAIACGWEDACDLDSLRFDPAFKLACGRLPDSGRDLCSQPTMSRWENAPDLRSVIRLGRVMLDLWLASYPAPPAAVTLDIDDTCDVVHGHQQLSLFNAHYDERCFLPIHVYEVATGRPVAMILKSRQDAVRQGNPRSSAPARPPHPPPLAADPPHHPRRRPLRATRGDGLVRGERHRSPLRPAGQCGARPSGRRGRRRHPHPPRAGEEAVLARLRRDRLSGEVVDATDTRTVRAALVPPQVFCGNQAPYLLWSAGDAKDQAFLLAVLCSVPLDWYARRYIELHLNFFVLNPIPIPRPPRTDPHWERAVALAGRLACSDDRFAAWAKSVGVAHGPLPPIEKQAMIEELDAVVARLYDLSPDQLIHIFNTFHEWTEESQAKAWAARRDRTVAILRGLP